MCTNNEKNDQFYGKVAFVMYPERVNFRPQRRKEASKLKPHRGLGTRLPSTWLTRPKILSLKSLYIYIYNDIIFNFTILALKRVLNCLWLATEGRFSQLSQYFLHMIVWKCIFSKFLTPWRVLENKYFQIWVDKRAFLRFSRTFTKIFVYFP